MPLCAIVLRWLSRCNSLAGMLPTTFLRCPLCGALHHWYCHRCGMSQTEAQAQADAEGIAELRWFRRRQQKSDEHARKTRTHRAAAMDHELCELVVGMVLEQDANLDEIFAREPGCKRLRPMVEKMLRAEGNTWTPTSYSHTL